MFSADVQLSVAIRQVDELIWGSDVDCSSDPRILRAKAQLFEGAAGTLPVRTEGGEQQFHFNFQNCSLLMLDVLGDSEILIFIVFYYDELLLRLFFFGSTLALHVFLAVFALSH